jgi:AcrR family transcriptional regulator
MTNPATQRQPSRDKILDRAEELFARRGFAGVGLAEVAEQVGLSKSSLFHHFSGKAQLYAAVMARILDRIEAELMRSLAEGGGPLRRLERWLDVVIDVLAAHPTYARLLLRSLFEDDELTGALPEEQAVNAQPHRGRRASLVARGHHAGGLPARERTAHGPERHRSDGIPLRVRRVR